VLTIAALAGYSWLGYHLFFSNNKSESITVCPIKWATGIPCPSCGSTRSVLSILHGEFWNALLLNPLGYVVLSIMFAIPIGLAFDFFSGQNRLIDVYKKTEEKIRRKPLAIFLITIIIVNWIWNIFKYT
jgi:hypothetical protein